MFTVAFDCYDTITFMNRLMDCCLERGSQFFNKDCLKTKKCRCIQARIAQLVAYRLGTREVPGSNPGKDENFSMKISN